MQQGLLKQLDAVHQVVVNRQLMLRQMTDSVGLHLQYLHQQIKVQLCMKTLSLV